MKREQEREPSPLKTEQSTITPSNLKLHAFKNSYPSKLIISVFSLISGESASSGKYYYVTLIIFLKKFNKKDFRRKTKN